MSLVEEHSFCRLFRTTKYYLYFTLSQLLLSLLLIAIPIFSLPVSPIPFESFVILLLTADMYLF